MTIESFLPLIIRIQKQSGLPPADFFKALSRLARNDAVLRTALQPSTWTVGLPRTLVDDHPIPALLETAPAASAPRQGASESEKTHP